MTLRTIALVLLVSAALPAFAQQPSETDKEVGVIPTILLSSAIMEIVISCQLVKEVARGLAYNRLALTAK